MWANAMQLVREAIKAVPPVRYAVGVAGVMAALALGATLFKSPLAAVLGTLTMFILMVLLLLFSAAVAALGKGVFHIPVLVMTWAILLLFLTSATLTVSAVFFDKPKPFPTLINQVWGIEPRPPQEPYLPVPQPAPQPGPPPQPAPLDPCTTLPIDQRPIACLFKEKK
jgi:hypothetical protein